MPIDLTTVPEGGEHRRSHRSRRGRSRARHRNQIFAAIGAGVGLLSLLVATLYLIQYDVTPRTDVPPRVANSDPLTGPTPLEKVNAPPPVESAAATSSGELPIEKAQAKLLSLKRMRGADGTDDLYMEYEFLKSAQTPDKYLIVISTPGRTGNVAFNKDAARRDVVAMSTALNQLGSAGPILVWIETIFPSRERVSNIMTLP